MEVQYHDLGTNLYGSSHCFLNITIELNSNTKFAGNAAFYSREGRHEMGHIIGMPHSGDGSSRNGDNPPTMATCISQPGQPSSFSQDDYSSMGRRNSTIGPVGTDPFTANIGFEQGTSFYGVTGGQLDWYSSGGATGPGHIGFKAPSTDYVYQTTDVASGNRNFDYRGVVNHKKSSGNETGSVRIRLYSGGIDYNGAANGCDYPLGHINLNSQTTGGYVLQADSGDVALSPTWVQMATPLWDAPNADGYRLQVRVYENATESGQIARTRFDNLRGELR
jgi:hypothetical protein